MAISRSSGRRSRTLRSGTIQLTPSKRTVGGIPIRSRPPRSYFTWTRKQKKIWGFPSFLAQGLTILFLRRKSIGGLSPSTSTDVGPVRTRAAINGGRYARIALPRQRTRILRVHVLGYDISIQKLVRSGRLKILFLGLARRKHLATGNALRCVMVEAL